MKAVGIITYHHYYNYGTALQAFALQKAIEGITNASTEIIDFRASDEKKLTRMQLIRLRFRRVLVYAREWKRILRMKKYRTVLSAKKENFDKFFIHDLVVGDTIYHSYKELEDKTPQYDIYVTGSDQTWSPKIGLNPAMFLQFAPQGKKRIAYAPSIGVSSLSNDEKIVMKNYLRAYTKISCREKTGVKLLNDLISDKEVSLVLDPTLLLTSLQWDKIAIPSTIKEPYILCYFIGHRDYYRKWAKAMSNQLNIPLYYIPVSWVDLEKENRFVESAGPREFLGLIKDATLILTDSFHGTIFSINYNKDFYSFLKIKGGKKSLDNSRITDILDRFNLTDRLMDEDSEVVYTKINYSTINNIIQEERNFSMKYLKEALQ